MAAITAAKNSREVILIEDGSLGGTCLNEGCIPTKALLESADMFEKIKSAGAFGIGLSGESPTVQWEAVQSRKREIIQRLAGGIEYLMNKNKIKVLQGKASFLSEHDILVEKDGKQEVINAGHVIIAAGAAPAALPLRLLTGAGSSTAEMPCHCRPSLKRFLLSAEESSAVNLPVYTAGWERM